MPSLPFVYFLQKNALILLSSVIVHKKNYIIKVKKRFNLSKSKKQISDPENTPKTHKKNPQWLGH